MKYKALMLDVDGTLVPYDYNALPSEKVRQAIKKAQEKVTVCLVTGREFSFIQDVLKALDMKSGYAAVNNGGNVVNLASKKILYDQPLNDEDTQKVIELLLEEDIPFYIKQSFDDASVLERGPIQKGQKIPKAYMFFIMEEYASERIDSIVKKLSHIPTITISKAHHSSPNKFGLGICHVNATKLHGIEVIMKELGLKREEIIGVGDGYNDFPLLMASGLKVAMGNAVAELKAIADYVAPSVMQDGVANVIEKFILSST